MVTAHAIVRYVERGMGYDLTDIRREAAADIAPTVDVAIVKRLCALGFDIAAIVDTHILTPTVRAAIACGAIGARIGPRLYAVIKDGHVVTVAPSTMTAERSPPRPVSVHSPHLRTGRRRSNALAPGRRHKDRMLREMAIEAGGDT